jgi:hypothetical protein
MIRHFQLVGCLLGLTAPCMEASSSQWVHVVRESQASMARAEPHHAKAVLDSLEQTEPETLRNPHVIYQRFFVALHGHGDRNTARLMLRRLDHLVANNELASDSSIYHSCTEAWTRSLLLSDIELHVINRERFMQRIQHSEP